MARIILDLDLAGARVGHMEEYDKKIEALRGTESLRLLSELHSGEDWKLDGVSIITPQSLR